VLVADPLGVVRASTGSLQVGREQPGLTPIGIDSSSQATGPNGVRPSGFAAGPAIRAVHVIWVMAAMSRRQA
jgi:hypothetical protein